MTRREVDLRYGITEEEAAEGQVLPILLAEIDRSRPYFIGLLGERYGWVPDEIPAELVEQKPWLAEHAGQSVIELEFLHGALRNPEMAEHAFFYLRDPAYLDSVPPAERGDYRETDPALTTELAALKQRIRESGLPVREDYHDPEMLGALLLADFTALIDSLFPAGSEPAAEGQVLPLCLAKLDTGTYPTGIKIPDSEMKALHETSTRHRHDWHPEWNDTLNPTES